MFVFVSKDDPNQVIIGDGQNCKQPILPEPSHVFGVLTERGEIKVPCFENPDIPKGFASRIAPIPLTDFFMNPLITKYRVIDHE